MVQLTSYAAVVTRADRPTLSLCNHSLGGALSC